MAKLRLQKVKCSLLIALNTSLKLCKNVKSLPSNPEVWPTQEKLEVTSKQKTMCGYKNYA
jgi:hypothetical protein